jgi:hypothetical protein
VQTVPDTRVDTEPAANGELGPEGQAAGSPLAQPAGTPPGGRDRASLFASASTLIGVLGSTAFVIWQLHPMTMLFTNAMDVGGDNAGHVDAVWYFIHYLLPHGQISGWDPEWLDGFPLYVFYFPLPAVFVAILNAVMPYAVAFKLVSVAGTVLLPGSAYLFGRLAGFRRPIPALMAVAMLPYLFNSSYTIDGGNIMSTMAGEFSFSLSLCFGLVFLGLVANGLETGRYRGWAAVAFAATLLCHVVPGLAFAAGAIVLTIAHGDWRRIKFLGPAGVTGALLASFWLIPFAADVRYSSSMNYTRVSTIGASLFPDQMWWVLALGAVGCVLALCLRNRIAIVLGLMTGGSAAAFAFLPSGEVYNARWLPFWFLLAALVAAYGIGELLRLAAVLLYYERYHETVGALICTAGVLVVVGIPLNLFPRFGYTTSAASLSSVPGWISWNYTGFQGKEGWGSYQDVVRMLDKVRAQYGCGRVEYEYTPAATDWFGSTEAFMSLPMYTGNCFDPTEGLYFESSTTTPFHFLDQAEYSEQPSEPVSGLPYPSWNVPDGALHSQLMGVRYLLACTANTEAAAETDPDLELVGSAPGVATVTTTGSKSVTVTTPFKLYLVKNSPLVAPLSFEPVVESGSSAPSWLQLGLSWYEQESDWPQRVSLGGPASWPHAKPGTLRSPVTGVPIDPTTVSAISTTNESISFNVSKIGVPVVVNIPYFPNWQATGADGPWEVLPNMMVLIPTSKHVTLSYGTSRADLLGYGATAVGVVLLLILVLSTPPTYRPRRVRKLAYVAAGTDPPSTEPPGPATPYVFGPEVPHDAGPAANYSYTGPRPETPVPEQRPMAWLPNPPDQGAGATGSALAAVTPEAEPPPQSGSAALGPDGGSAALGPDDGTAESPPEGGSSPRATD